MTVILIWIVAMGITRVAFTDDPDLKFGYAVIAFVAIILWTLLTIFF
jgi:hypothetical protein